MALWANYENRRHLEDLGRSFVEEAYNYVAIAYNPVHPKVYPSHIRSITIAYLISIYMYI
jgi:hypothetical protein